MVSVLPLPETPFFLGEPTNPGRIFSPRKSMSGALGKLRKNGLQIHRGIYRWLRRNGRSPSNSRRMLLMTRADTGFDPLVDFAFKPAHSTGSETDLLWELAPRNHQVDGGTAERHAPLNVGKTQK